MSVFDALGETTGKIAQSFLSNISGLLKFKDEQLSDIDRELAVKSLDPSKYENPDVKKLVEKLKEKLSHSPASLSEWVEDVYTMIFGTVSDVIVKVMIPFGAPDFETAKASAGALSSAFSGFILLASTLDAVGTAMSGTLVRNIFRYIAFMLQFFGFQKYMDIALMPAVNASILPRLVRGYNKQYKTFLPPTPDLITMMAHEAFEPGMIEKYKLHDEKEALKRDYFYEQGLDDDTIDAYWASHWVHASWGQVTDMLHRGELTNDDVWEWFRVVEIPPYWRQKLINISWDLPNRIETRMMARYGLVDKPWLVEHLKRIGLHEDYRSIAADFMLAMGIRMDISARYSKGWLTREDVKTEIDSFGMEPAISDRLYMWIIKNVGPEQVEESRALTKTEIYKGVKAGTISPEQGVELLMDMGYDRETADYLIEINVGVLTGSPHTFEEFKSLTQSYRRAIGLEAKPVPEEIKVAGEKVVKLTGEVAALTESVAAEEKKIIEPETAPEEVTAHLKELRVSLHRAEAELQAAKSEYDRLVAEWRHGLP